jgi:Family of unknown function (DUF6527)
MFDVFVEYATVVHLWACGCGAKVVCPLDPTDYAITSDGQTVSLWRSVGKRYCQDLWMRLFQATSVSVDPASGSVGVMSTGRSSSLPL